MSGTRIAVLLMAGMMAVILAGCAGPLQQQTPVALAQCAGMGGAGYANCYRNYQPNYYQPNYNMAQTQNMLMRMIPYAAGGAQPRLNCTFLMNGQTSCRPF